MLNAIRTISSTVRLGALCSGAAILLSACGGAPGLGDGPDTLAENMPSNVTAGTTAVQAAQPGVADAGSFVPAALLEAAPAAAAPASPEGAAVASAEALVYPPSEEASAAAPVAGQDGAPAPAGGEQNGMAAAPALQPVASRTAWPPHRRCSRRPRRPWRPRPRPSRQSREATQRVRVWPGSRAMVCSGISE